MTTESNQLAKRVKLTPEGVNQADIDAVLKRWAQMRKRLKADILFLGAKLAKIRNDMKDRGDRSWTRLAERTLPFSVKSANLFIRAWEGRDSELAIADWDTYMRVIYGNVPKKLRASTSRREDMEEDEDEDRDDLDQTGGGGLKLSGLFPDKDKADFYSFRKVIQSLEEHVFTHLTPEAKRRFIDELIKWLENERKH